MTFRKRAIVSLVLMSSFASPVFAQGETPDTTFGDNTMTFTTSDGKMVKKAIPPKTMAELMTKGAMPMTAGVMMMMHQGKMYMMNDQKMPDGKMMSDMAMGK